MEEWLVSHFRAEVVYTEKEVNAVLEDLHTFSDVPLLRRHLIECGLLQRDPYGKEYRLA